MPPEAIKPAKDGNFEYNEQLDVYSFAIVMWETVTRRHPFVDDYEKIYTKGGEFDDLACKKAVYKENLRPKIDAESPPLYCSEASQWMEYCAMMCDCWAPLPRDRPKIEFVSSKLEGLYERAMNLSSQAEYPPSMVCVCGAVYLCICVSCVCLCVCNV